MSFYGRKKWIWFWMTSDGHFPKPTLIRNWSSASAVRKFQFTAVLGNGGSWRWKNCGGFHVFWFLLKNSKVKSRSTTRTHWILAAVICLQKIWKKAGFLLPATGDFFLWSRREPFLQRAHLSEGFRFIRMGSHFCVIIVCSGRRIGAVIIWKSLQRFWPGFWKKRRENALMGTKVAICAGVC